MPKLARVNPVLEQFQNGSRVAEQMAGVFRIAFVTAWASAGMFAPGGCRNRRGHLADIKRRPSVHCNFCRWQA